MSAVRVRLRRLHDADPALPLPEYQTGGAAGMDVLANLRPEHRAEGIGRPNLGQRMDADTSGGALYIGKNPER